MSSEEWHKMKDFHRQEGAGTRRHTGQKTVWLSPGYFPLGGWQADYLTSTDQVIPD